MGFIYDITVTFLLSSYTNDNSSNDRIYSGPLIGGIVFVVNSNVKLSRICTTVARGNSLTLRRYARAKFDGACSTGECVASSTTNNATLTANDGAGGNVVNVGTSSIGICSILCSFRRTNETANFIIASPIARTAPTSFCTRRIDHGVCSRVTISLMTSNISFFTNNKHDRFVTHTSDLGLISSLATHSCHISLSLSSIIIPILLPCTKLFTSVSVPSTARHNSCLPQLISITVGSLSTHSGRNFFLVIRNSRVSCGYRNGRNSDTITRILSFSHTIRVTLSCTGTSNGALIIVATSRRANNVAVLSNTINSSMGMAFGANKRANVVIPVCACNPNTSHFANVLRGASVPTHVHDLIFNGRWWGDVRVEDITAVLLFMWGRSVPGVVPGFLS